MKKLVLDVEKLRVESFRTAAEEEPRATVRAMSETNHLRACTATDCTCPGTCDGTGCDWSMPSYCQGCSGGMVC